MRIGLINCTNIYLANDFDEMFLLILKQFGLWPYTIKVSYEAAYVFVMYMCMFWFNYYALSSYGAMLYYPIENKSNLLCSQCVQWLYRLTEHIIYTYIHTFYKYNKNKKNTHQQADTSDNRLQTTTWTTRTVNSGKRSLSN